MTATKYDGKQSKQFYTELGKLTLRDTAPQPGDLKTLECKSKVTGNVRIYVYCPACTLLLNVSDFFCRYCGQRIRREED